MFIQTETTPNPATLKFIPGRTVMESGTANFVRPEEAAQSPLALRLFEIAGVAGVFFGADFVTVTKMPEHGWEVLKPMILSAIMDHFMAGEPLLRAVASAGEDEGDDEADDELVARIKELIDTRVRPAVAMDGGDIVFRGFEEGVVYLHMQGACSGCPSSTATLKHGIENMLRYYVPEVIEVRQVSW
jgi:Fe-S cluster biogenesis protein NfuA